MNMNHQLRAILLASVLITISATLILLNKEKLSTDISVLLPNDPWIQAHLQFMRNSRLGSVIAISIEARNKNAARNFPAIAGKLDAELNKLHNVEKVIAEIKTSQTMKAASDLFLNMPQLFSDKDLTNFKIDFNSDNVRVKLQKHFQELMTPGGLFRQKLIARDPMGFFSITIKRLKQLSANSGFFFNIDNSILTSRDGKHMLVLIYADLNVTDPDKSQLFFEKLKTVLNSSLPEGQYETILVSAHRHAIDNKKLLQRDITITMLVAGLGFFILFMFFFKDWRSIYIFLIPIIGMLISVALTFVFFSSPSAIILGLGTTVIGIALDYGIHIYTATKHSGELRNKALSAVKRPLIFSALTTLGVFWAFFLSETPGYRQLAFASTMGIAISLLLSIYILPSLLPENLQKENKAQNSAYSLTCYKTKKNALTALFLWLFFILLSISMFFLVNFESDIRKLDGINSQQKADEEIFKSIWGKNTMAAATTKSDNLSTAMRKIDILTTIAIGEKINNIQSLSQIWPSLASRKLNGSVWIKFWKSGNEQNLKNLLITEGRKFSFSDDAFSPFFENLYKINYPSDKTFITGSFSTIAGRFINYKNKQWHVTMFFPDTMQNVKKMKQIASQIGNIDIISPGTFGSYISKIIINDALKIGFISIILTILLALICLKNFQELAAAFLPVISGLAAIFPAFIIFNTPINTVSCVASIIVTGLAIDYGIFSVSACKKKDTLFSKDAFSALSLSLISTVIGSSALLFADHPALFSVGLVVSSGVLVAYLTAVFITPALLTYTSSK